VRRSSMDKKLEKTIMDLVYTPSHTERRVKAAYIASLEENPVLGDQPTIASVSALTGDSRIAKWWSKPGFKEWFLNKDEFRQKVEYLATAALDTIEEIMADGDANPSSRIAAAKLMMEAARKLPKAGDNGGKFADDRINEMTQKELEIYIAKSLPAPKKDS